MLGAVETYLDTIDGSLFLVNDDRVDIAAKHSRHRRIVLALSRFAKVDDTATHT